MKRSIFPVGFLLVVLGFIWGTVPSFAQPYPNRPIQWIIPGAAGSILDIAGRLTGDELAKILGAQLIPVVKPGAGFTLGTDLWPGAKRMVIPLLIQTLPPLSLPGR